MNGLNPIQSKGCRAGNVPAFFMTILALSLLSINLCAMIGCTKKNESLPVSGDSIATPYQEFKQATMTYYTLGRTQWVLQARTMRKLLTDTGSIVGTPVILTLFDSTGRVSVKVRADSGTTSSGMERFVVWGNVHVQTFSKDPLVVRSQKLWWVKTQRKVYSNTFVQITTQKGDVLRGKGLDAEEDFSRWSFKQSVSGEFPNFKARVEKGDEW